MHWSDEIAQKIALHTRIAVAADLLFVSQIGDAGLLHILGVQRRHQSGISAHLVVVAVSADHAAVKTDVLCLEGRRKTQLGREEIALGDAVFFIQYGREGACEAQRHVHTE